MQFYIQENHLCCTVSSRSTDIYTGLPYDMGFFSFVTELVYKDLKEKLPADQAAQLKLGYTAMKTTFTQIYDKTRNPALDLLEKKEETHNYVTDMPAIENAQEVLDDIYSLETKTPNSPVMKWVIAHAKYTN